MAVVWDTAPYSLVEAYRRFIALMMEAVRPSETSVNFKDTTRRYIQENCHLTRRRENLKAHTRKLRFTSCNLCHIDLPHSCSFY